LKLQITDDHHDEFTAVATAETDNFSVLVSLSGLRPSADFQNANLSGADFADAELSHFNFDRADLRKVQWRGRRSDPLSCNHALMGNGADEVSGDDFVALRAVCHSKVNWDEQFYAFKTLVDNWGESKEISIVLIDILSRKKGTYLRLCAFLYFFSSYSRDEKMKSLCEKMAFYGRSQINLFRLRTLRKGVRDYLTYSKSLKFEPRFPGDIDRPTVSKIQEALGYGTADDDQRFV
jgi:hypothetical protein